MTKDVELHSDKWSKMTSALSSVTEHSTSTGSGYGNYSNQFSGDYGFSSASKGFSKRIEPLETISERVQQLISEKDSDGVVSYSYHQMRSRAQELESKLSILENYSSNVPTYIKTKIDEPFYKAMDKVGEKLEALNIQKYKIPNTVGYKQVEPIKDDYQRVVGTKEVMPEEISINELYKLKNPYQLALQQSYSNYQNSKDYKEHPLTQEEYLTMMLNTRHFEYVSIDDEKSSIEMWRDFVIGAGIVALYIFCPPAGAVTNTIFAGLEFSSAVSGKDWGTGRELNDGERALRGAFALVDLIPAGKYLGGLAKTGKTAGVTAVKTSLKTSLKEGFEQGAKNVDNFKGLWTGIKTYGDNMISQITTFGKPLDNLRPSKILSNSAEALSDGLRHADNVLSEATQNFRLNMGLDPQLVTGTMSSGGGRLTNLADNLSAFAKSLDGSVDEVVEAGGRTVDLTLEQRLKDFAEGTLEFQDVLDDYSEVYAEIINGNKKWSWDESIINGQNLSYSQKKQIKNLAIEKGLIPDVKVIPSEGMRYGFADFRSAGLVQETVNLPEELWLKTDKEQFEWLNNKIGGFREGMTWHHTEIPGQMELVPFGIHNVIPHNGGRTIGMWAYAPR